MGLSFQEWMAAGMPLSNDPMLNKILEQEVSTAPALPPSTVDISAPQVPLGSRPVVTDDTAQYLTPQSLPEAIAMGIPSMSPVEAAAYGYNQWQQSRGFPATPDQQAPLPVPPTPTAAPPPGAVPSGETGAPTPPPAPTPSPVPAAPSPGLPTAEGKYQYHPGLQYGISSQGTPMPGAGPTLPPTPPPTPKGPSLAEDIAIGGGMPAPVAPTMDLKDDAFFAKLLQDREAAFPSSREAALASVGRRPGEFRLKEKSVLRTAFEAFAQGLAGLNTVDIQDKEQKRLRDLELSELEWAMKKFSHEDQVRVARYLYEKEADSQKRAGMLAQGTFMLNNLPPDFPSKPQDAQMMAQIYAMLGAGYRLPKDYVQEILNRAWNPKTGQYEGLYIGSAKRWELESKAKAESIMRLQPGTPQDVAMEVAITGKWPEWANDLMKSLDRQIAMAKDNPTLQKELIAYKNQIVQYQRLWAVKNYVELINGKGPDGRPIIPIDEAYKKILIAAYINQMYGGPDEGMKAVGAIEQERVKGEYAKAVEAMKQGGAGTPGKRAEDLTKSMAAENQTRLYYVGQMNPANFQGIAKDPYNAQQQHEAVKSAQQAVETGKATPQQVTLVQEAMNAQLKIFKAFMPQTAAAMEAAGVLPRNHVEAQKLYDLAAWNQTWGGIDDATMAANILEANKLRRQTESMQQGIPPETYGSAGRPPTRPPAPQPPPPQRPPSAPPQPPRPPGAPMDTRNQIRERMGRPLVQ